MYSSIIAYFRASSSHGSSHAYSPSSGGQRRFGRSADFVFISESIGFFPTFVPLDHATACWWRLIHRSQTTTDWMLEIPPIQFDTILDRVRHSADRTRKHQFQNVFFMPTRQTPLMNQVRRMIRTNHRGFISIDSLHTDWTYLCGIRRLYFGRCQRHVSLSLLYRLLNTILYTQLKTVGDRC